MHILHWTSLDLLEGVLEGAMSVNLGVRITCLHIPCSKILKLVFPPVLIFRAKTWNILMQISVSLEGNFTQPRAGYIYNPLNKISFKVDYELVNVFMNFNVHSNSCAAISSQLYLNKIVCSRCPYSVITISIFKGARATVINL